MQDKIGCADSNPLSCNFPLPTIRTNPKNRPSPTSRFLGSERSNSQDGFPSPGSMVQAKFEARNAPVSAGKICCAALERLPGVINAVANDDPDCVVPWHRDLPDQSTLFG